jgi:ACS family tartrate transporter-like MFS transporter
MTALPITTIIGAPVSGSIIDHVHWLNLGGWRWLMMLQGCPAVLLGALAYGLLPNNPSEAVFLSGRERAWLIARLDEEAATKRNRFRLDASRALTQGRVWLLASIGIAHAVAFYSFVFWTPQAVKALAGSLSNTQVGFLVAVPQLIGLLAMLTVARSSDRRQERKYHVTVPLLLGAIGFISLGMVHTTLASMALLSLASVGVYGFVGPFFASGSSFLTRLSAASGLALITSVANLGGFVGPYVVGVIGRTTGSIPTGFVFAGISMSFCAALCFLLPNEQPLISRSGLRRAPAIDV